MKLPDGNYEMVLLRWESVVELVEAALAPIQEKVQLIEEHPDQIYVRDSKFGKIDSYALTELEPWDAIRHICRFVREAVQTGRSAIERKK